jgi:hypothetical protein
MNIKKSAGFRTGAFFDLCQGSEENLRDAQVAIIQQILRRTQPRDTRQRGQLRPVTGTRCAHFDMRIVTRNTEAHEIGDIVVERVEPAEQIAQLQHIAVTVIEIRDGINSQKIIEDEMICAIAAAEDIGPRTAKQPIIAVKADQNIIARAAHQRIVFGIARDVIVPATTDGVFDKGASGDGNVIARLIEKFARRYRFGQFRRRNIRDLANDTDGAEGAILQMDDAAQCLAASINRVVAAGIDNGRQVFVVFEVKS